METNFLNENIHLLPCLLGKFLKQKVEEKYIGDHMPKNKELNNDCSNNNQLLQIYAYAVYNLVR